jgi:hypothetical protein
MTRRTGDMQAPTSTISLPNGVVLHFKPSDLELDPPLAVVLDDMECAFNRFSLFNSSIKKEPMFKSSGFILDAASRTLPII